MSQEAADVTMPTEQEKSEAMFVLMRIQENDAPTEEEAANAMLVILKTFGIPTDGLSRPDIFAKLTEVTSTNPDLIKDFFDSVIEYRQSQMLPEGEQCACCSGHGEQQSDNGHVLK